MKKQLGLIVSMLKVGVIGFGGGNALIPVIQQEVVEENKYITQEEYEKDIVAATLTPGALPVEIASGVGKQMCGMKGMILGGVLMAFPGALITVLLMAGMSMVSDQVLSQIQYASIGITAFIMCLLTEYIRGTFEQYKGRPKTTGKAFLVCLAVFLLTAGKNLYRIFQIDATPIFSISTIDMLAIAFFGILVTDCKFTWQNLLPAGIISGIYLLCIGKAGVIDNDIVTWVIRVVMIVMSVYSLKKSRVKKMKRSKKLLFPLIKETTIWLVFAMLCSIPAIVLVGGETIVFVVKGLFSSLISFGGGDAYLTIADGLFVPDYIDETTFYNNLVLLVNVLPGSILCKTLSGVGYAYGMEVVGNQMAGFSMALSGFVCSVAASCGVFGVVYHLYEYLEGIEIFINIKKSIKVIVSGMLMTVMSGLIQSCMSIGKNASYPWFTILLMVFAIYGLNVFLFRKAKCKNLVLIGMSLVLSMGICNVMGI
nr:chromate transporter [Eubacterium sp.]